MALGEIIKKRPLLKKLRGQNKREEKVIRLVCYNEKCVLTLEDGSEYECSQVILQDFGDLSESRIDEGSADFSKPVRADLDPITTFLFGD